MSRQSNYLLNYQILGKRISNVRKEKQITQDALARACHCSVTHLSHIENGESASLEILVRICSYLQISMDDALGITAARYPLQRKFLDLLLIHSFDEQQLAFYLMKVFFVTMDLMKELKRSVRLEDVLRRKSIDINKLPKIELFEEPDRKAYKMRKLMPEPMASEDSEEIILPIRKKNDLPTNDEKA